MLGRMSFGVLLASQLIATMGFTFVIPFTPLYVQQLGVEDAGHAAAWAGFVGGAAGLTMTLSAPLWGRLADRVGRKLMLLRAMLAGSVVVGLMGLVSEPWELLVLRLLQGALTGTVPAAMAFVASNSPVVRVGHRLGALQTVVFVATAAGPFFGGIFADLAGIQASFFLTSILLAASSVVVMLGVPDVTSREGGESRGDEFREVDSRAAEAREGEAAAPPTATLSYRLMFPGLVALFLAQVALTSATVSLPGFLSLLDGTGGGIATLTGQIIGTGALVAALGSAFGGRLADRLGARTVFVWAMVLAGLTSIPQAWVTGVPELWALRLATSLFLGGVIPVANLAIKNVVPSERQGTAMGVASSAVSAGFAAGPIGGGLLAAALGFWAPFLIPGVLLVAAGATLWVVPQIKPGTRMRALWRSAVVWLARIG